MIPTEQSDFPPMSTTLKHLLAGGDDSRFRKTIYGLLSVSAMMLRTRELYGSYIGISAPQYTILMVIAEESETTVGHLAATLHTSGPFITSEVNKLVALDLVSKRPNENDRRSTLLELTKAGRDRIYKVSPMRTAANDIIFGSLNPAEAEMLQHLVNILNRDFEKAVHMLEGPEWKARAD